MLLNPVLKGIDKEGLLKRLLDGIGYGKLLSLFLVK
jgi:hypothetical protein